MDFTEQYKNYIQMLENALDVFVSERKNLQNTVYKAMRYSLLGGGKRIRGVLCLAACEAAGGKAEDAVPIACAVEMIHAYSLIHDDLPSMDNDDMRRGKPSCHKAFGEAMAILAGDGLLSLAFETVIKNAPDAALAWRALRVLAEGAGPEGMLGGQVVDIESENCEIDMETLNYLHSHKTGALIKAACVAGGITGGGNDEFIKALEKYAENIGLAFQIQDDVLDVEGSAGELGKTVGSDAKSMKSTFVTHMGVEESKSAADMFYKKAADIMKNNGFMTQMAEYLSRRKN